MKQSNRSLRSLMLNIKKYDDNKDQNVLVIDTGKTERIQGEG